MAAFLACAKLFTNSMTGDCYNHKEWAGYHRTGCRHWFNQQIQSFKENRGTEGWSQEENLVLFSLEQGKNYHHGFSVNRNTHVPFFTPFPSSKCSQGGGCFPDTLNPVGENTVKTARRKKLLMLTICYFSAIQHILLGEKKSEATVGNRRPGIKDFSSLPAPRVVPHFPCWTVEQLHLPDGRRAICMGQIMCSKRQQNVPCLKKKKTPQLQDRCEKWTRHFNASFMVKLSGFRGLEISLFFIFSFFAREK